MSQHGGEGGLCYAEIKQAYKLSRSRVLSRAVKRRKPVTNDLHDTLMTVMIVWTVRLLGCLLACENIRFFSLFVAWDVPSGEERGETDVFAGNLFGGFHVTSSPPCWWTVNKRSLISSFCLSTSICSFHHCYLCLLRLDENNSTVKTLQAISLSRLIFFKIVVLVEPHRSVCPNRGPKKAEVKQAFKNTCY